MTAFSTYRRTASERLMLMKGWQNKGLTYWEARVVASQDRIRNADSFTAASRARDDLELAQEAVRQIEDDMAAALGPCGR